MKTFKFTVHTFNMGDVEDPEIYVAGPLFDWQQTEKGKWIMEKTKKKHPPGIESPTKMKTD